MSSSDPAPMDTSSNDTQQPQQNGHEEQKNPDPTPEAKAQAEALKAEGNKLFAACKFSQARDKYTEAIELDPKNAALFSNRAFCDLKLEEYGSALMDADKAIAVDRGFVKAYYRRGAAHLALGKYRDAIRDFKNVVRMKPSDKDAQAKLKECERAFYAIQFQKAIEEEKRKPPSERWGPVVQDMQVDSSYEGPHYVSGKIDAAFIESLMDWFKQQKRLPKKCIYQIVLDIIPLLRDLPTLVDIDVPAGNKFTVCGDVHGQFYDVLNLFSLNGLPSETNPYLFNGDFVDRGSFSLEVIVLFFSLKLLYPNHFHLLRGNHETLNMNQIYGFQGEVAAKVDTGAFDMFSEAFNLLPLAACLKKKVLVVHGGLFSEDGVKLDQIRAIDRNQQPPESGLMTELLWSDPQKPRGRAPSKRGVGLAFGPDVTKRFLEENGLELIIRSHEVKDEGYEIEHDGQLITVFSAPNYVDQMGNKGAYINFNGDDMKPKCVSFTHVPHPPCPPMAYAAGMFR